MYSLTTVFHLVSLVLFGALVWGLVETSSRLKFSRKLWASVRGGGKQSPVLVDWPSHFLKKLCLAWGIPFETDGFKEKKPGRINPKPLIRAFEIYGIRKIRYHSKGGFGSVSLEFDQEPEALDSVLANLECSLGDEVFFRQRGSDESV